MPDSYTFKRLGFYGQVQVHDPDRTRQSQASRFKSTQSAVHDFIDDVKSLESRSKSFFISMIIILLEVNINVTLRPASAPLLKSATKYARQTTGIAAEDRKHLA
jgi:hypothetical protein